MIKNSKIFFVSAPRGMWCDFVAYQLSLDERFYNLPLVNVNGLNKWNVGTVLPTWQDKITFDLKAAYTPEQAIASSIEASEVVSQYSVKHLAIQSHYCDTATALAIPNIVPTRIVCDPYYYPLFFILGVIKVLWDVTGLIENKPSIIFLCQLNKINNPFAFIDITWISNYTNTPYKGDYKEFNLLDIVDNRCDYVTTMFDVEKPLDSNIFKRKFLKDIELVEQLFGTSYDNILKMDWKKEIKRKTFEILTPFYDYNLLNHFYKQQS